MSPRKTKATASHPNLTWRSEDRPAASLVPWEKNPRRITDRQMAKLKASLQRFGYAAPILVNTDGQIVAGHMRLRAMQLLGMLKPDSAVTVRVPSRTLTPAEARDLAIIDNRVGGTWDWDALANDFSAEELLDLGFEQVEIDGEFEPPKEDDKGLTDPDAIPTTPKTARTRRGDLYLLGDHRLLCGDCTDQAQVARLIGPDRAGLMNTDPPYGIAYDNTDRSSKKTKKTLAVQNDDLTDAKLQAFLESAFRAAQQSALRDRAAWYLWHAHLTQGFFAAAAAAAANVVLSRQIIWVKPSLLLTRGQYHWKHEPCFFGWVKGKQPPDYGLGKGERTQTTVWEVDGVKQKERKDWDHSIPKPVELFRIPLVKHLKRGEICYEPFAGTGPQFIAAEETGTRCFGLEIEPLFCDVIVKRWEEFTGKKAVLQREKKAA